MAPSQIDRGNFRESTSKIDENGEGRQIISTGSNKKSRSESRHRPAFLAQPFTFLYFADAIMR